MLLPRRLPQQARPPQRGSDMNKGLIYWMPATLLFLASGYILLWQSRSIDKLQTLVSAAHERTAVEGNGGELADSSTKIPLRELQRLREDRIALLKLRAEIESLKQTSSASKTTVVPAPPAVQPKIPASDWRPAGRTSPKDALLTMLWAGKHGNIDVMSAGLTFATTSAQEKAAALLAAQPPEVRTFVGTPERLIAQLTANAAKVEAVQFPGDPETIPTPEGAGEFMQLPAYFHLSDKPAVRKTLFARRAIDGWQFLVSEQVVDSYEAQLSDGSLRLP